MKTTTFSTWFFAVVLALAAGASRAEAPTRVDGGVLTTTAGMTLYIFDGDHDAKSSCNGACASNWPPLIAQDNDIGSGDYSVIARDDGKKQWAYKGKPLYQFAKDQIPGDKVGDGFKNVWHAARA